MFFTPARVLFAYSRSFSFMIFSYSASWRSFWTILSIICLSLSFSWRMASSFYSLILWFSSWMVWWTDFCFSIWSSSFCLIIEFRFSHSYLSICCSWIVNCFYSFSFLFLSSFWIAKIAFLSYTFYRCCCCLSLSISSFFFWSRLLNSAKSIYSTSVWLYLNIGSEDWIASRLVGYYVNRRFSTPLGPYPPFSTHQHSAKIFSRASG